MSSQSYLKGMLAGASLSYILDPDRGARRRGMLRDRIVHLGKKLEHGLEAAARDARKRSIGIAARTRQRFSQDEAPDAVIQERVRSCLGRVVSHPHAIHASVMEGRVTLSGPVLASQAGNLLAGVRAVRGVTAVENRLDIHDSPGNVPGLQGNGRRPQPRSQLMQQNWTPSLRLLMGTVGAATLWSGRRRSGVTGAAASAIGSALLARAATNLPTRRMIGVNGGRQVVTFHKTLNIAAPVEEVWAIWSHFENFPRFMSHLEEVRITGEGRSHWVARGPAGSRFQWDAEITQWVPNEVIAWKSSEGASVANTGLVRFQPNAGGGTRVDVHLSYNPPAGAVGHLIASLTGSDAKRAMDEDMVRLKSLIEEGKASVGGETVTREALDTSGTTE